jgi:glycosyltransferase involved in cell wall biosynthesis
MLDLSVIVPTFNRRTFLPELLESLAGQDYPGEKWEMVIVDDGSADDTVAYLRSDEGPRPVNLTVVEQANGGPATARNNGAKHARGRALLFLDDDMVASPSLVREHAMAHLEQPWSVVVGHLLLPDEGREPWVAWEDAQMTRHFEALKSGRRVPGPRDFFSGNCSVAADLFNHIGGYDTTLQRTEDVELGYRLRGAGANFAYRAGADSLHLGHHKFEGWLRIARLYGHSDVQLAWEKGHTELRREIFHWYHLRQAMNRALVRLCSALPVLESPAIRLLDIVGRVTYKRGVRKVSIACYSAIYNLAYWMAIERALGRRQFWSRVKREKPTRNQKSEDRNQKSEIRNQNQASSDPVSDF